MADLINKEDEEVFAMIDEGAKFLRTVAFKTTSFIPLESLTEQLSKMTGCFMYVTTGYNRKHVARENNEINKYMECKRDASVAGEKFVSAVAEREARNSVQDFATAEEVLEGYKLAAEQAINTLKRLIEVYSLERQKEAR